MTLRTILPRRTLRDRDNSDGRYPTIARTGDAQRTGRFNVAFDDSDTHLTVSGSTVTVSYPTSLRIDSPLLEHDMTSSITAAGHIDRGTVEVWQRATKQVGVYAPFREVGLHEQDGDKSNAYFLTGSDPADIGFGLKGRLDAKTVLRFELPIQHETHLDPHTASVYYYNTTGFFEEKATSRKIGPGIKNYNNINYGSTTGIDVKFFDALGNFAISGSTNEYRSTQFDYASFAERGVSVLSTVEPMSVLADREYAATTTQSLAVSDFTDAPFVIERIEIELPFKAGPGWFNDYTRYNVLSDLDDYLDEVAGPGITFALSSQLSDTRRELIGSATFFPHNDMSVRCRISPVAVNGYIDPVTAENVPQFTRYIDGLPMFSVDPTVVVSPTSGQFTGTLRFTIEPRVSNGIVFIYRDDVMRFAGAEPNSYQEFISPRPTTVNGIIHSVNAFGRAGNGSPSGRSIFGREFVTPKSEMTSYIDNLTMKYQPYASDGVSGSSVGGVGFDTIPFNAQGNVYSPYVVQPTDRLIFSISKYHAAVAVPNPELLGADPNRLALTASHDVSIPQGAMRVSIYGSHVRNGHEFHDTLNTPLTSDAVHETINYDPILDQFKGVARAQCSGSYLDHIITGSYTLNNGVTMRGSIGSKAALSSSLHTDLRKSMRGRQAYEFGGTNVAFAQASSPNERYWDSLVPAISEIFETDGATFYSIWGGGYGKSGYAIGLLDCTFADGSSQIPDNHITREFPFGPRYGALSRRLEQDRPRVNKIYDYDAGGWGAKTPDQMLARSYLLYPAFPTSVTFKSRGSFPLIDWTVTEMTGTFGGALNFPLARPPLTSDVIKFFFGFGDFNSITQNSSEVANVGTVLGTTTMPTLKYLDSFVIRGEQDQEKSGYYMPIIRGWKYGVMNGLPQYSKAIYRNDRYGQFRDRLEQRVFGAFYETVGYKSDGTLGGSTGKVTGPVTVRFVARDGTSVNPARTESSNLSNEATSSLPFFDGELRNRLPVDESMLGGELVAPLVL